MTITSAYRSRQLLRIALFAAACCSIVGVVRFLTGPQSVMVPTEVEHVDEISYDTQHVNTDGTKDSSQNEDSENYSLDAFEGLEYKPDPYGEGLESESHSGSDSSSSSNPSSTSNSNSENEPEPEHKAEPQSEIISDSATGETSSTFPISFFPDVEIEKLRRNPEHYKFEWHNWIKLGDTPEDVYAAMIEQDVDINTEFNSYQDFFNYFKYDVPYTRPVAAFRAALFLNKSASAPQQIILLPEAEEEGYSGQVERYVVHHADRTRDHLQFGYTENFDLLPHVDESKFVPKTIEDIIVQNISKSEYSWNMDEEIDKLRETAGIKVWEEYKNFFELDEMKHFNELQIFDDVSQVGNHIDWRFFRNIGPLYRRPCTIQSITRAWHMFAELYDITYWWAHGSTIGWMWDGLNLPYDVDTDLQVPMQVLSRLAREFNGSLIVQHPSLGNRSYYLDVGPNIYQRYGHSGKNYIDARFIDIQTGHYVDITGMTYIEKSQDIVTCKRNHKTQIKDISPLRLTMYEGGRAFVPFNVEKILGIEYTKVFNPRFKKYSFRPSLRLWVEDETAKCPIFFGSFKDEACDERAPMPREECPSELETCDQHILDEYNSTRNFTLTHNLEMKLWSEIKKTDFLGEPELLDPLISLFRVKYPLLHRCAPETFN